MVELRETKSQTKLVREQYWNQIAQLVCSGVDHNYWLGQNILVCSPAVLREGGSAVVRILGLVEQGREDVIYCHGRAQSQGRYISFPPDYPFIHPH